MISLFQGTGETRPLNISCCLFPSPRFDPAKHLTPFYRDLAELCTHPARERIAVHLVVSDDLYELPPGLPDFVSVYRVTQRLPGYLQHLYRYMPAAGGKDGWWLFRGTDGILLRFEETLRLISLAELKDLPLIVWPNWMHRPGAFPMRGGFTARSFVVDHFWAWFAALPPEHLNDSWYIDEHLLNDWFRIAHVPYLLDLTEPISSGDLCVFLELLATGPACVIVKDHKGWARDERGAVKI